MRDAFFEISKPFTKIETEGDFYKLLDQARHINNIMYMPNKLLSKTIVSVTFENVSFSKTDLKDVTFKNCIFKNCLFISSIFDNVRFHSCSFNCCNFFRAKFNNSSYAKPGQFKNAICDDKYANIAVGLFEQLRLLYKEESQKKYKAEAEYYFNCWLYVQNYKKRKDNESVFSFYPKKIALKMYGKLFGYGYRLRNLVFTTSITFVLLVFINRLLGDVIFDSDGIDNISESIYFTITTMLTLGASGFGNPTYIGRWLIIVNVLMGISLLSFTVTALFNRIIK